ncbi:unnamed protein product [Hymenolepis diminuta]|uniref:Apple domain-containing protein n=1 Tax=Hymenolepis diminuta TaxID=6216 RepID=A0A0R3SE87_HYMDI|nr:unnamed protein product [Hymenolepis diminuta]VUZ55271.1 unnamed protein product [Hymenolepis diminuta]
MIRSTNILSNIFILLPLLLPLFLVPISAYRFKFFDDEFKFSRPCKNNTYDPYTGNFRCTVKTGEECFQLCQQQGCFEWSFISFMASTDRIVRENHRCRCNPGTSICFYTYIPYYNRDYE